MSCVEALSSDLGNIFLDPQSSDIVLICQEEEIRAHKLILSARSPVFRAMLQTDMSERANGEIKINDADKDVLKEMVGYLYTAKVEEKFTKYKELLILANKYEVEELIKLCGTKVAESLNDDNALQVGVFAELHNAEDLMKACVKYIMDNKPNSLNQNWEDLVKGSPKMMAEMIRHLLDDNTATERMLKYMIRSLIQQNPKMLKTLLQQITQKIVCRDREAFINRIERLLKECLKM